MQKLPSTVDFKWFLFSEVEDEDDHVLRNKLCTSEAGGNTFILKFKTDYNINNRWESYFNIGYTKSDLNGTQDQYWYGDDPGTVEDETGMRINGINYENEQAVFSFDLGIVYKF